MRLLVVRDTTSEPVWHSAEHTLVNLPPAVDDEALKLPLGGSQGAEFPSFLSKIGKAVQFLSGLVNKCKMQSGAIH